MGWLGWSFDQAMRSDVCAILLAYQGAVRRDKQIAIRIANATWAGDDEPEAKAETSARPMTPELFKALFE
jgi:hypothetical protein